MNCKKRGSTEAGIEAGKEGGGGGSGAGKEIRGSKEGGAGKV